MNAVENLLHKTVKLRSVDEDALTRKRVQLKDARDLLDQVSKEIESTGKQQDLITQVQVVLILTTMVTDIIRDTLGVALSETHPLMKMGLEKLYDKARDEKWEGNRNKEAIETMQNSVGYLEKLIELIPNQQLRDGLGMVIQVQKTMAANMMGMIGALDDGRETQRQLKEHLRFMRNNLKEIDSKLQNTNFYLETGEGPSPTPMFTPIRDTRLH